ncbi:hypothetical protein AMECASPLE_006204 [Ameca splendens]|uniref:Uncharacterized protein n=1 Tax=Ameca splendens TaxID=208324 RepID=A0ABV0ZAC3_9TELE
MSAHCVQAFCYEIKREEKIREGRSLGYFEGFSMMISITERKNQSLVHTLTSFSESMLHMHVFWLSQTYRPSFLSSLWYITVLLASSTPAYVQLGLKGKAEHFGL